MEKEDQRTKEDLLSEITELQKTNSKLYALEASRDSSLESLSYKTALEILITTISSNFINLQLDRIDMGLEQAIETIGKFFHVDRSYIFIYSNCGRVMTNTHEWCRNGIEPQKDRLQSLPADTFPWFDRKMKAYYTVFIKNLGELPNEAYRFKNELIAEKINSLICVPMVCRGKLIGFVGFDSVSVEREFSDDIMVSLRMIGEVFANAIDRKNVERELRENEYRFRDFFENASVGFHISRADRVITGINNAELEMIGYTQEEIVGLKKWSDLILPEQIEQFEDHWQQLCKYGHVTNLEYTLLHKNGTSVNVTLTASARFDENEKLINTRTSVVNVTKQKLAEQNYLEIFNSTSEAIFVHDMETAAILDVNKQACEMFGYSVDEMLKLQIRDISVDKPPHTQEDALCHFKKAAANNTEQFEWLCKHKSGKQFWVEVGLKKASIGGTEKMLAVIRDITERKRADLALYMSEQRFRAIADYTYDWEIWVSPGGRPLWTNSAVERTTGYSVDECMRVYNFPEPFVAEDDRQETMKIFNFEKPDQSYNGLEFRLVKKDQSLTWVSASWQTIYDKKGTSQGYRVSIRDISSRKRAELAIQTLDEGTARATGSDFLKNLIKHLALVMNCKYSLIGQLHEGPEPKIETIAVWTGADFAENFQYELKGTPCANAVSKDICYYPENIQQLFPEDHLLKELNAESYLGVPLFDANGKGIGILATLDVEPMVGIPLAESILRIYGARAAAEMERQFAEEAVRINQTKYQLLFEAANDAIFIMKDGYFIDCNDRTLDIFGCTRDQIVGETPSRFSPEKQPDGRNSSEKAKEKIDLAINAEAQIFQWRHTKYDGTPFDAEVSLNRLELNGELFLQAMVRDITHRKKYEAELECLLHTLAQKNEELESIVYASSHDLRSPLVNIEGFSTELSLSCEQIIEILDKLELPDEQKKRLYELLNENIAESIGFIKSSTQKMDTLLGGLLKLCRLGKTELNIRKLDMNEMIGRIIDMFKFQISKLNISVLVDDLPMCMGDAAQLDQAFSNLIDNAIKYRSPDRNLEIRISGSVKGGTAEYTIEDNGIGIQPEHQHIIFEIFHRLNPNDTVGGEGLGLTIVKRIITRQSGNVYIESKPDVGTCFRISLPRELH